MIGDGDVAAGIVVPLNDEGKTSYAHLVTALQTLIEDDPLRERFSRNARRRFVEMFDIVATAQAQFDAYFSPESSIATPFEPFLTQPQ